MRRRRDWIDRIQECAAHRDLARAREICDEISRCGACVERPIASQIVRMFGKCGSVEDARRVFDLIEVPDTAQWNILVMAYAQNGHSDLAKTMFDRSPLRDLVSWNTMIQAFAWGHRIDAVVLCLERMPQHNVISWNTLLSVYAQTGHIAQARELFDAGMPERDVISWNTAIALHAQGRELDRAWALFDRAPEHSVVTWNAIIARGGDRDRSKRLFDDLPCRDVVSWNSLIQALADAGDADAAREAFERMPLRDAISWIATAAADARSGRADRALESFHRAPRRCLVLWNVILSSVAGSGDLDRARSILAAMPRTDVISWNTLLSATVEFSDLAAAATLFRGMPHRNLASWTLLVGGYAQHAANPLFAAAVLRGMPQWDVVPWNAALSAAARGGDAAAAKDLFDRIPDLKNLVSWSILCELGALNPSSAPAAEISSAAFQRMPERGIAAWLAMIAAAARRQWHGDARTLFERMPARCPSAWNLLLGLCAADPSLEPPAAVLRRMPQWNLVSWNIAMSSKIPGGSSGGRSQEDERFKAAVEEMTAAAATSPELFDSERSIAFVTTLIARGGGGGAKAVFDDARVARRDVVAWTALLAADPANAAAVHARMPAWNTAAWNALVSAHGDNAAAASSADSGGDRGALLAARAAFDAMPERNLRSWNCLVAAYVRGGAPRSAVELYERDMAIAPNEVTLSSLLDACAELCDLARGAALHARAAELRLDRLPVLATAILNMYGRCGRPDRAKLVFDAMRDCDRDLVAWNAMIGALARNGLSIQALELYRALPLEPDASTLSAALEACSSSLGDHGRAIHERAIAAGLDREPLLGSALVNFYTRSGELEAARRCFARIRSRSLCSSSVVAWNSMLLGFAQHGRGEGVIETFAGMLIEGVIPDAVSFVAVLGSFAHAGRIGKARSWFHSMAIDFAVAPIPEHYCVLADLLGRLGQLDDARELIHAKPFEPGLVDWMSLLSASRIQCDIDRGFLAAAQAFEIRELDDDPVTPCRLLLGMVSAGSKV